MSIKKLLISAIVTTGIVLITVAILTRIPATARLVQGAFFPRPQVRR